MSDDESDPGTGSEEEVPNDPGSDYATEDEGTDDGSDEDGEGSDEDDAPVPSAVRTLKSRQIVFVLSSERITSDLLQDVEMVAVISARAQQIATGGTAMVHQTPGCSEIEIAAAEISERRCPLEIHRKIESRGQVDIYERWKVNEMIHPPTVGEIVRGNKSAAW